MGTAGRVAEKLDDVMGKQVLPIPDTTPWPPGPDGKPGGPMSERLPGGVAIVLDHARSSVDARADFRSHQPPVSPGHRGQATERQPFVVESPCGRNKTDGVRDRVVEESERCRTTRMPSSGRDCRRATVEDWSLKGWIVRPSFRKCETSMPRSPAMPRRTRCWRLLLSILVIMAYIWFRFGNLKYGTATMVAIIHDTLFTIAAIGFAHYLVKCRASGRYCSSSRSAST